MMLEPKCEGKGHHYALGKGYAVFSHEYKQEWIVSERLYDDVITRFGT